MHCIICIIYKPSYSFSFFFSHYLPMGSVLLCIKDIPTAISYCLSNEDACPLHRCFLLNNSCVGKTNFVKQNQIPRLRLMLANSEKHQCKNCRHSFRKNIGCWKKRKIATCSNYFFSSCYGRFVLKISRPAKILSNVF